MKSLGGVLKGTLTRETIVLLGKFNAHLDSNGDTRRGAIERPLRSEPELYSVISLVFMSQFVHNKYITNSLMLKHKAA